MKENDVNDVKATRNLPSRTRATRGRVPAVSRAVIAAAVLLGSATAASAAPAMIKTVGVENEYADVISQVGGRYVQVTAIETDPNTDPHTFEVNPKVAGEIASADLVVKNGVGYDAWADKIIAAAPNARRKVIDVQHLLGLSDSTPNPHLWYDPKTMPAVAKEIAADLAALDPAQAGYFQANAKKFDASLKPWLAAIAAFKAHHAGTPVAVTGARCGLHAGGGRHRHPDALQHAGGHHERHRPVAAGRDEAERPSSRTTR